MERTPDSGQDEGVPQPKRRFGGSRLQPKAAPRERAEPTPESTQAEEVVAQEFVPTPGTTHPPRIDPSMAGEMPFEPADPIAPRGFAGGRVQVLGFPGCLIVSVVLSLLLTLLLNLLV